MHQVLINLFKNALEAMPQGGQITLATRVKAPHVEVSVSDTGEGMPPEVAANIFQPYFTTKEKGTGLGLAITQIRLPIVAELPPPPVEAGTPALAPRRIVLIEDNDDGREAVTMALRALGLEVQAANSGQSGIELALRGRPDLVLIDIGLPDLDGYEVARVLRLRLGERVKLIALTGYGQQADRKRSEAAGFDAHLVKPVAPKDLLRLL